MQGWSFQLPIELVAGIQPNFRSFQALEDVPVPPAENEPVETKLTDPEQMLPSLSSENRVHNPSSILYAAFPAQPVQVALFRTGKRR